MSSMGPSATAKEAATIRRLSSFFRRRRNGEDEKNDLSGTTDGGGRAKSALLQVVVALSNNGISRSVICLVSMVFFLCYVFSKYHGGWSCLPPSSSLEASLSAGGDGGGYCSVGSEGTTTSIAETSDISPRTHVHENNDGKEEQGKDNMETETDWEWFDNDVNEYYNNLEKEINNRDPTTISSYAVHRTIGPSRSTEEHYKILDLAFSRHSDMYGEGVANYTAGPEQAPAQVLDAGCGLGSSLMWMEQHHPTWNLTGHTISAHQYQFIQEKLPPHNFTANLKSYDDLDHRYDFIFSIEALVHSPDVAKTLVGWSRHLNEGGVIAIIDDFLAAGTAWDDGEVLGFAKAWMAPSVSKIRKIGRLGRKTGLSLVEARDLGEEYRVNEINYRFHKPKIERDQRDERNNRNHQAWVGSKFRQRLMVDGKFTYNLVVLKKQKTPTE